jgi:lipopolysaccharide transport system permease protein
MELTDHQWDIEIQSKSRYFDINFKELWRYRDLLFLLVKRDYKASFKQTILGPVWFFIQPLLTTFIYIVVFANIARLGTDGKPAAPFYLAGIIVWNYFATCLTSTSSTFVTNSNIFGKVYFPRLIMPMAVVISNLAKFGIQFVFFLVILGYYLSQPNTGLTVSWTVVLTPLLLLIAGMLGLSAGLIISSLTTKYRDVNHLIGFFVQFAMYATPVVYPLSIVSDKYRGYLLLNPMTGVIETFKYSYLGSGHLNFGLLAYSFVFATVLFAIAITVFSKVEKSFMDTV